jgi:hypothetical protein
MNQMTFDDLARLPVIQYAAKGISGHVAVVLADVTAFEEYDGFRKQESCRLAWGKHLIAAAQPTIYGSLHIKLSYVHTY